MGPTEKIFDFQCFRLAENAHKSKDNINFTTTHSITQTGQSHMIPVALNGLKDKPLKNERGITPRISGGSKSMFSHLIC